ncbi:MAG: phenylalanine--tRNA ligase subunit beta [Bacteroidota bacterium]
MKISYNWLKQFIKIDWEADKTAELLTDLGLEIEGVRKYESIKGGLKGVVVGHVLSCKKHPDADRLKLTEVNIGNNTVLQIICGASNIAEGQKVPVAKIGTVLYDSEEQPWTIKKSKIRGEESCGMICSEAELGLGEDSEGIMILDEATVPGTPCAELFNIEEDVVFEIELTPNRADAMSHFGVARDLTAGLLQHDITTPLITPSVSSFHVNNRTLKVDVAVEDQERCSRYCGITIDGLKVSESPDWLKNRLIAIGLTPKNNVVDATNYVLHELGQPLHAFDVAAISGNKIIVKTVKGGTTFTTLDGVVRELHEEDLMICDTEKPLCIAGVFGGLNSGVTENTRSIFLESARFDPVAVRSTAKRHGLNTDASFRFERGVDINNTEYAMRHAAILIQELAGGEITSDIIDIYPKKIEDFQVFLTFEKIHKLVGQEIPEEKIKQILTSLDIKINNVTEAGIGLTIPSYRVDVYREADVIEEILRVYGHNKINVTEKLNSSVPRNPKFEPYKIQNTISDQLVSQGFYEIMTNSLVSSTYMELSKTYQEAQRVRMLNPLSSDLSEMRQSLLFSGLGAIAYNLNRKQHHLKFFEFGKTYHTHKNGHAERKCLGILVTGDKTAEGWEHPPQKSNFFYIKGVVMAILQRLGVTQLKTSAVESDIFATGIVLRMGKTRIVELGSVKQSILTHFDIKQEVFFANFSWDVLLQMVRSNTIISSDIPKFPEVRRDFSMLIDKAVTFESIRNIVSKSNDKRIKAVNLFDVYEGENLPEGKKSYAVRFILRDEEKTLTDKEIDTLMNKLQKSFEKQLGAVLRS